MGCGGVSQEKGKRRREEDAARPPVAVGVAGQENGGGRRRSGLLSFLRGLGDASSKMGGWRSPCISDFPSCRMGMPLFPLVSLRLSSIPSAAAIPISAGALSPPLCILSSKNEEIGPWDLQILRRRRRRRSRGGWATSGCSQGRARWPLWSPTEEI